MKICSPDLSATQIPPMCCRVYGEVCDPAPTPPAPAPPGQEQVDVTIRDVLGDVQYSESLNFEIDGESKGDLIIQTQTRPEAEMTISLAPGSHNYEIQGTTQALAPDGSVQQYPVQGKGQIDVLDEDNQLFEVQGGWVGNTLVVELVRQS
jgi:hypothetical protein